MTDIELLHHLLNRPGLYLAKKTGSCLLMFLSAYALGHNRATGSESIFAEIMWDIRREFGAKYETTTHRLWDILDEVTEGNDVLAFEALCEKLRVVLSRREDVT